MLWNCKMRYGKTVTAYELIKCQHYQKVIVITHRPAVEDGWGTDHDLMFAGENIYSSIKQTVVSTTIAQLMPITISN